MYIDLKYKYINLVKSKLRYIASAYLLCRKVKHIQKLVKKNQYNKNFLNVSVKYTGKDCSVGTLAVFFSHECHFYLPLSLENTYCNDLWPIFNFYEREVCKNVGFLQV